MTDRSLFSLEGKLALVTGATGVLCSAMCRGLAMAGAHVLVTHRREDDAELLAAGPPGGGISGDRLRPGHDR